MADILPFKAVRPTRDKVGLVASRSYDTYSKKERETRLTNNPFSFLHIVNPGYKFQKDISGKERYSLVRNRYLEFKEDQVFIQDEVPLFYVYKITDREKNSYSGIIAAASAEDYENNVIKKHESTIAFREIVFKEYLKTVGFNAEPVLLTHPDNADLQHIINQVQDNRAEYEFTTTYRDTHMLWPVTNEILIAQIQAIFREIPSIYIADGHHRCASSYLLYQDEKSSTPDHTSPESYKYFMAYLIPESALRIHEFNRLVTDLNGLSKEEFLIKLDTKFRIENRGQHPYKPSKKHHFSMYLDGEFYSLFLRKTVFPLTTSLEKLDAYILYKFILHPILGINDLRTDKRISYANGKKEFIYIKNQIDQGHFKVGFGMLPATVEEMKKIADEGLQMPPKSTYIEPKLRSGITIYEF
ncbi:DUF1015 domain-containing protein [Formosa sp. S-31]|uniref:DUF1015 domain-containing protein n=1 Tax=Formosa sp. S-31 TaxID=2790949 RepID=UPI003EBF0EED